MTSTTTKSITLDSTTYHTTYSLPAPSTSQPDPTTAPLVVLIHALMATSEMYTHTTTTLLSHSYRVLSYDHVGHGASPSPTPNTTLTFDAMTHHLHRLLSHYTTTPPYALIGCSMGAVLAIRYAMLYHSPSPARIMALGIPGFSALEEAKPLWTQRIQAFETDVRNGTEKLAHATAERWLPGDEERSIAARSRALDMTRRCSLAGYVVCADAIREYVYEPYLGEVKGKVMVLIGSRDSAVGDVEKLRKASQKIPDCEFVVMDGVGHLPPVHDEEGFEERMVAFLKS
ncbi:hypothetical protein MBLNU457_4487t1 [Dothideomycetes sp. NU457]